MLKVLFVCTGNRCRSPFAAASFAALTEGLPVQVESAGTAELGPVPPTADAIVVAHSLGVDIGGHAARSLSKLDARAFDLVIGFERNHIATAVVQAGVPFERAFLLPELERLLRETSAPEGVEPAERVHSLLSQAHAVRGTEFVPGEEVVDPIGRPQATYQEVYSQIHDLNASVAMKLFGPGAREAREEASAVAPDLWGPSEASVHSLGGTEAGAAGSPESPVPEAAST